MKAKIRSDQLKDLLEEKYRLFNQPNFIELDPISVPHRFRKLQDIEIAGFFAAILAWGQRKTIINKSLELMQRMDNAPYQFVMDHSENDLKKLLSFKHRTFNATDTLYFVEFFKWFYNQYDSLEQAFVPTTSDDGMEQVMIGFHNLFFSLPYFPNRTIKHVPTPIRKSTCKRMSMFLRWMVRKDENGVDFGLWKKLSPKDLICPCDLHVDRVARALGLIKRKQTDWLTALELTNNLKTFDPTDPVKYDFALFGLGIIEGWSKNKL